MEQSPPRSTFSGAARTILATAGVAIGLGNVWRFPYMMGAYGGSAFLVIYVALAIAFGIPALMVECALGRHTRQGPAGAYRRAGMPGAAWWSGLVLLTVIMGASYYGVVLAWVLGCAAASVAASIGSAAPLTVDAVTGSIPVQTVLVAVTVLGGGAAVAGGVRRGIERLSAVGVPLFFALFLLVLVRVLSMEGAWEGLLAFLVPRPGHFKAQTAFAALGQVFFSLGLGGTFMVTYGSYLREGESIPRTAIGTAAADLAAALLAGAVVVPAVLALRLDLAGGPTLLFTVMPRVFAGMPSGALFGAAFFFSVFLVGMLSLIAAYEVVVDAGGHALGWSRRRSLAVLLAVQIALSVPALCVGGYIRISDLLWGTTMQPVGSALAIVAVAWCLGRARALEEIARASRMPVPPFLFYWIKYVLPVGIAVIAVSGWMS